MNDLYSAIFGDGREGRKMSVHDLGASLVAYAYGDIKIAEIRARYKMSRSTTREFRTLLEACKADTDSAAYALRAESLALLEESGGPGIDRPTHESLRDRRRRFWEKIK